VARNVPATVLVVEGEETICEIIARFLANDGLVCVTVHSGEAALEWLHTNKPWPDLFIVDVRLPGMTGPEFVLEALGIRQGTPILYISGYPQGLLRDPAPSDTVAFLSKPFSYEHLLGEVRRLLSIGSPGDAVDLSA
jgi:two-component system, cell cycle sensor histidine kinase and response regulator CckA